MEPPTTTNDPVPALGRGLAPLERLHRQGACSREQLAADSGWPKSSVMRLLRSRVARAFGDVRKRLTRERS
ncbi:MAG: helix-turn-helix domain-containing protein [Phycisphaeraceae bacterium]